MKPGAAFALPYFFQGGVEFPKSHYRALEWLLPRRTDALWDRSCRGPQLAAVLYDPPGLRLIRIISTNTAHLEGPQEYPRSIY